MSEHNAIGDAHPPAAPEAKVDPATEKLQQAALLENRANYTAKEAVAVMDNSGAVDKMFPGDQDKQNAAYRIIMHDMKVDGYPQINEADSKLFTPEQMKALSKYAEEYKPSLDLAKVDAEAKELQKLGFPSPPVPADQGADHSAEVKKPG